MSRRTDEQKYDVMYYANQKELDYRIIDYCKTREQVDTMILICSYVLEHKDLYDYSREVAYSKPERTANSMKTKLEELSEYYERMGAAEALELLNQLQVITPRTFTKEVLDDVREQIIFWLDDDGSFTAPQKDNLVRTTIQWFKETDYINPLASTF